jgi:hypothetical protein
MIRRTCSSISNTINSALSFEVEKHHRDRQYVKGLPTMTGKIVSFCSYTESK